MLKAGFGAAIETSHRSYTCWLKNAGKKSKKLTGINISHYDHIREDIEQTIPGFENYNQGWEPGGFYLPIARAKAGLIHHQKAKFNIAVAEPLKLKQGQLMMMTIRSHDRFNTTIYGLDDRYRAYIMKEGVILMNRQDMTRLGLQESDVVDLVNNDDAWAYRSLLPGCTIRHSEGLHRHLLSRNKCAGFHQ